MAGPGGAPCSFPTPIRRGEQETPGSRAATSNDSVLAFSALGTGRVSGLEASQPLLRTHRVMTRLDRELLDWAPSCPAIGLSPSAGVSGGESSFVVGWLCRGVWLIGAGRRGAGSREVKNKVRHLSQRLENGAGAGQWMSRFAPGQGMRLIAVSGVWQRQPCM